MPKKPCWTKNIKNKYFFPKFSELFNSSFILLILPYTSIHTMYVHTHTYINMSNPRLIYKYISYPPLRHAHTYINMSNPRLIYKYISYPPPQTCPPSHRYTYTCACGSAHTLPLALLTTKHIQSFTYLYPRVDEVIVSLLQSFTIMYDWKRHAFQTCLAVIIMFLSVIDK